MAAISRDYDKRGAGASQSPYVAECARLNWMLRRAESCVRDAPDSAALLLDGFLARLAAISLLRYGEPACQSDVLPVLDVVAPPLSRRLRLALRAQSVEARIVHARQILDLLAGDAGSAWQACDDDERHGHQAQAQPSDRKGDVVCR